MSEKCKVVIAEDNQLFREGLKALLASWENLEVVGEAEDGIQAFRMVQRHKPHLLFLDLSMPKMNGVGVLKDVKSLRPETIVLVLTIHQSDEHVLEAFKAGADGYCIKDTSLHELKLAIDSVLAGKRYISAGVADSVLEGFLERSKRLKPKSAWDSVTRREREVLKLVAEGYQNKEIADMLNISIKTVEKHRANIMTKLDLHNAAALAAYATRKGLLAR
jgi:DNA-binding NarL/FixJ family response regulator